MSAPVMLRQAEEASLPALRECRGADLGVQCHCGTYPDPKRFDAPSMRGRRWFTMPAGGFWTADFDNGEGRALRDMRRRLWTNLLSAAPTPAERQKLSLYIALFWAVWLPRPFDSARVLLLDSADDLRAVMTRYPYTDEAIVTAAEALGARMRQGNYALAPQPRRPPQVDEDALQVRLFAKWHSLVLTGGDLRQVCGEVDWLAVKGAGYDAVHMTERGFSVLNATWQITTSGRWGPASTLWLRWVLSDSVARAGTMMDSPETLREIANETRTK